MNPFFSLTNRLNQAILDVISLSLPFVIPVNLLMYLTETPNSLMLADNFTLDTYL